MTTLYRPIGIDLGTTNSAVGMLAPDGHDLIMYEDRFGRRTLPSLVGWHPEEERVVTGWEAWRRRALDPAPIASIKRKMGTRRPVELGPTQRNPREVSALILESVQDAMASFLAALDGPDAIKLSEAVITVPAYFDAPQIQATREAGALAGLQVAGLLQEPTAAAMYYAWKHRISDGTFLVYDLGGGTFDVSIIRSLMGEYQVLAIDGDNFLGGDDFDRRLAEHLRSWLTDRGYALDLDIANDPQDALRFDLLTRVAQQVKEALTNSTHEYIGRRDLFKDQLGQPVTLDLEIARAEFEGLIDGLIAQTIEACLRAIDQAEQRAGLALHDIDHVLLVGGSTRVPLVQKRVAEALCGPQGAGAERPLIDEPDSSVALGAAIHAANLQGTCFKTAGGPTLRVSSPLYHRDTTARLRARVEPPGDQPLTVALLDDQSDVAAIGRVDLDDGASRISLADIPLPHPGRHPFALELCDANADALHRWDLVLYRHAPDEAHRPTGSSLSNPTVLAKDIHLEVREDGRARRERLLERGTSLPARKTFRFFTGDDSGAVILRLFQNRFPIRSLHLDLPPSTPAGSPVALTLEVDEAMEIIATGEVLGQQFWAQIEPPPLPVLRGWSEVEALLSRVEQVEASLWGFEAASFEKQSTALVAGIRETARTDPDKMQVLAARLEDVLDDYLDRQVGLSPGYPRFQTLLNAVKRVVYRGTAAPLGRDLEQWRDHIHALERDAEAAWAARDPEQWRARFDQLQATWESLAQEEYRFTHGDEPHHLRRRVGALTQSARTLRRALDDFTLSDNPQTRALQTQSRDLLKQKLETRVEQPLSSLSVSEEQPVDARRQLDRVAQALAELDRSYRSLPTLGLVRR